MLHQELSIEVARLEIAGVREDHAYEQYFFDAATCAELVALMRRYDRPLLVCTPSLAVAAEAAGVPHVLLDRDERFAFLRGFRPFDLHNPAATAPALAGYAHDVVICDPPFANVEIPTLRAALDALAPDEARRAAPLYVAFNARREGALEAPPQHLLPPRGQPASRVQLR